MTVALRGLGSVAQAGREKPEGMEGAIDSVDGPAPRLKDEPMVGISDEALDGAEPKHMPRPWPWGDRADVELGMGMAGAGMGAKAVAVGVGQNMPGAGGMGGIPGNMLHGGMGAGIIPQPSIGMPIAAAGGGIGMPQGPGTGGGTGGMGIGMPIGIPMFMFMPILRLPIIAAMGPASAAAGFLGQICNGLVGRPHAMPGRLGSGGS